MLGRGLATGWSPRPRTPTNCLRIKKLSETKRFTDALCSKVGAAGIENKKKNNIINMSQDYSEFAKDCMYEYSDVVKKTLQQNK
jgi:hypothetical protein